MATTSNDEPSKWSDPPPDILLAIADHVDCNLDIVRLRSTCHSWRLSLSSFPPITPHFPLKLPNNLTLLQRTVFLLSPLSNTQQSFIIKVEEKEDKPNTFSLIYPLSTHGKLPQLSKTHISLLDYRVTRVCELYAVSLVRPFFLKVVVARNFFKNGDLVVLALNLGGKLQLWKTGDVEWTKVECSNHHFDDIISFRGKFYGITDRKGRLVMIDSRLQPINLVPNLMYGNGRWASLVECDDKLYLVDREIDRNGGAKLGVFKLDDKGRFWDYEPNLNGSVFFLGDDANFSLSRKVYDGCTRDAIYFRGLEVHPLHGQAVDRFAQVFDMKTNTCSYLTGYEDSNKLHWPPLSWFIGAAMDDLP